MSQPIISIKTIGVYGTTEESFFSALVRSGVDTFCDIRQRRAVRGSKYAYVNSNRLQTKLRNMGINYVHIKELAPSNELRARQKEDDNSKGILKSSRAVLGKTFVDGYLHENLQGFNLKSFLSKIPSDSQVICLFCVEREAQACHRSLVATALQQELSTTVENLLP